MNPSFVKIIPSPKRSFIYKQDGLYNPAGWHFHPELELLLVVSGTGTRFVGDSIEPFLVGDLVLLGENLPHSWQADLVAPDDDVPVANAIVVQFSRQFLGEAFFETPEFSPVNDLLDRARQGLLFTRCAVANVAELLIQQPDQPPMEQVISLLRILGELSVVATYRTLARPGFLEAYHRPNDDRFNRIYEYTIANFHHDITLPQIALVANLTEAAFCRYFRVHTRKTYVEFLNEIRIGYACRLLLTTDQDIAEVCYQCGFTTLSNFNRRFRRVTDMTPTDYRNRLNNKRHP